MQNLNNPGKLALFRLWEVFKIGFHGSSIEGVGYVTITGKSILIILIT